MEAFTTFLPKSPLFSLTTISPTTLTSTNSSELIHSFNQQALFWAEMEPQEKTNKVPMFMKLTFSTRGPSESTHHPFPPCPVPGRLTSTDSITRLPCPLKVQWRRKTGWQGWPPNLWSTLPMVILYTDMLQPHLHLKQKWHICIQSPQNMGFSCGSAGKESTYNAGDLGSIPQFGRAPGQGKGCPFQYSGLENPKD